ncbi:hypothetical protein BV898_14767 [Hypsibius exemplaris]|uniref:G-protein coupled receptors family 1 profile domain-containing protein n=1 Tax=Hypsibius exemplaris TaxID=2072580 RepID=A0A9X6NIZ7_HYPEX|nr:hypothetical protein BV898_14767 [Hypsibius exemplaris]
MAAYYKGNSSNISVENAAALDDCNWPEEEPSVLELPYFYPLWVMLILRPILVVLGTIGSAFIITVQLRQQQKSTTNLYLIVMAICCLVTLWASVPNYCLHALTGNGSTSNAWHSYGPILAELNGPLIWLQYSAVWISDCTLVVFSLERLLCTMNPIRYHNFFNLRHAIYLEAGIAFFSLLWTSEIIAYFHYKSPPPLLTSWDSAATKVDAARCVCIWLILMVVNVILVRVLAKHTRSRKSLITRPSTDSSPQDSTNRNSSILLLSSAIIYSITQFPFIIYNLIVMTAEPPYCSMYVSSHDKAIFRIFGGNLSVFGYSADFYVFYLTSTRFRQQVDMICCKSKRKALESHKLTENSSSSTYHGSRVSPDTSAIPISP